MNQHRYSYDLSGARDGGSYSTGESTLSAPCKVEPGRHCAYNQTRSRFLSADVDAADFTGPSLDIRLGSVAPESGIGLWLAPFRGISPTSVRVPVDLIYLDRNCRVIETVESFPLARVSATSATAASVLVLPSDSIASTETRAGDVLILCAPEEMKRRLQKLASEGTEPKAEPAAAKEDAARPGAGRVLQWEDRARTKPVVERAAPEKTVEEKTVDTQPGSAMETGGGQAAIEPAKAEPAQKAEVAAPVAAVEAGKPPQQKKSWLQKLLGVEPADPRRSQRETLPGLSAYFFTGGTPVAHGVRDISLTGMYVLTGERWYPGTTVRMTLTDRQEPTAERSITLHATVMRWGNDGVGLRFVLRDPRDRRPSDGTAETADINHVEQFLAKLRNARS